MSKPSPDQQNGKVQTLYSLLESQAVKQPGAPAILAPGQAPLDYGSLYALVEQTVDHLNALGIGRNDRVALVLPNGPEMAAAFLAIAAGATSAPLNPNYTASEHEFYLGDLSAKALVVPLGGAPAAREAAERLHIPVVELLPESGGAAGNFSLDHRGGTPHSRTDFVAGFAEPEDIGLVLHTSGTTSRPKIVPLTQANICASAHNIRASLQLAGQDRCLNVMPLFHIHGLIGAVLSSLAAGGSIVCTPGFQADRFFDWVEAFQPTWYTAVPTMHQAVLEQAASYPESRYRSSLRLIRSCSASLPPRVMAEMEGVFGVPVIESYGMTEAAHQMTSNPLPPRPRKPGSVGIAAGPEVAIVDEAGTLLAPGMTGEIVIRGANVMPGYENNPRANESAFCEDWFRTGDQGYMDEEGYLFITGRIKELINRGGEKIAPREVDEALLEHPAVGQAVTFALPHRTLGEDVAAAVVLRPSAQVSETELRAHVSARLATHKVPTRVIFVKTIPKGPTGKLQRIGLAEKLADLLKTEYLAPRNEIEALLVRLWSELLEVEQPGVYDNFFLLGGDSLRATQLLSRLRAALGLELPADCIFRRPVLVEQAELVETLLVEELEALSEEEALLLKEQAGDQ
jgi:acyl-CoA synthetase (AMP-forming)/AMP-acid ligase II